ncbi:MAG: DUF1648 domain-containing protein [Thermoprotei archaeon]
MSIPEIVIRPLSLRGKILIIINILGILIGWIYMFYHYSQLPEIIATNFNSDGAAIGYGHKSALLIAPTILTITILLILLIIHYRFTLVMHYPWLINLPAFSLIIASPKLSPKLRAEFINRIFNVVLLIMLGISWLIPLIAFLTINGAINKHLPFNPLLIILPILIMIPISFYIYYQIYHQLIHTIKQQDLHTTRWFQNI